MAWVACKVQIKGAIKKGAAPRPAALPTAILCFFLALILFAGGCATAPGEPEPFSGREGDSEGGQAAGHGPVKAVTTIFPLADITRQIGGDEVEVATLLAPGASPHTYEPTVEQARAVAGANLVFYIGGGLDDWAVKLAAGAPQASLTEISHQIEYDPGDPHIWLDPLLVKESIAPLIAAELASANPQAKDLYQMNLLRFQDELAKLHTEIAGKLAALPQKRFFSYHSAWGYYAHRYGLEEVAAVEEFPGKEPSARWIAELVKLSKQYNTNILLADPQLAGAAAEVIAQEIGGEVLVLDPLGGDGFPGRDSYVALLRYNTELLTQALR